MVLEKEEEEEEEKNKGKRKLADAVDANTFDFTVPSSESPAQNGYVDQHVIYYNQQNDWSRLKEFEHCKSLLKQFNAPTDIQKACLQKSETAEIF